MACFGQQPAIQDEKLHGRQAYVLSNGKMRVAALRGGGHIAEVRLIDSDARKSVNPMRVPHYQTIEPYDYDPARHDALYGADSHRWLSSGYMGHLLCFPQFGPPAPDEVRAGLGNHGEAPIVEWKQLAAGVLPDALRLRYGGDLPKTQYRVERLLTLPKDETVLYVEEWVENLAMMDRPINWVQHATFGPPFIEAGKNYFDTGPVKERAGGGTVQREFTSKPATGGYYAMLMDTSAPLGWFTSFHSGHRVLIGYLFPTVDNPWIADWQENQRNKGKPWEGKAVARGIEFGSTPLAEGLRRSVERATMLGAPTYRWIGARQRLKTVWAAFLMEIPEGYRGTETVRAEGGRILVTERETKRTLDIKGSLADLRSLAAGGGR
jgi:hypothetical protein